MMDERKPASSETVPAAPQTEPPEPAATSTRLDESLRDLQRARTEFAASISRDVRTPLTLLLGPLQDILDSAASALAPGSRSMLETARRNAFRLLTLLDALPDSSRIESGGTLGARAPADLASVTAALVGTFQSVCDAAGLRLIVDCPPLAEALSVDPDAWEKIVVNLVANAFKTTTTGAIEVRLRAQDGNAQLIVSDTGAGMSENELRYVFERIDRVATQDADGSGRATFGLPFVRSLVRRHNGSIDVQSAPGRGTRCIVLLPLESRLAGGAAPATEKSPAIAEAPLPARADARSGSQATAADAAVRRRGHVVVAEDHAETRDYLCHVLEAAGFIVDAVADGLAALAICGARAPDVVVSDVLMPGLSGFELIERVRADERTAVIPVLLLSARGGEDSRIAGIVAGADDYLVKPLSSRELIARVDGAVRLGRLRRETARREQADLDALFSMAPDGLVVIGQDGSILKANEHASTLFGYSAQEFLGLQIEGLMPASHRPSPVSHRDVDERAPAVRLMNERRGLRKDGSEFDAEIALGPLQFKRQACTIAIVRDITDRRKLEAERAEQEQRFRELSRRLVEVQESERRRLSADLHDQTSPQLAAIQINLRMLGSALGPGETEDVRALLDDTVHLIAETTASIREISSNLRPAVLDDGGLLPALTAYAQQFTRRTGILVHLHTQDATSALAPSVQSSLFRIVQEALTNCVKHANARNITLRLSSDRSDLVSLVIADDGIGFDYATRGTAGLGLLTMRERAEFLGGHFSLDSRPGHGTRILVLVRATATA